MLPSFQGRCCLRRTSWPSLQKSGRCLMCPDLRSVNCPATKSDRISAARLDPDGCAAQSDVNLHSEFASFLEWKRECKLHTAKSESGDERRPSSKGPTSSEASEETRLVDFPRTWRKESKVKMFRHVNEIRAYLSVRRKLYVVKILGSKSSELSNS